MIDETTQIPTDNDLDKISILTNKIQSQLQKLTGEQKDKIGKAYLKHVLGINELTIEAFMQDEEQAEILIGMKQIGKENIKQDIYSFWRDFCGINHCIYSESEKNWLTQNIKSPKTSYGIVMIIAQHTITSAIIGNYDLSAVILKIFETTNKYKKKFSEPA